MSTRFVGWWREEARSAPAWPSLAEACSPQPHVAEASIIDYLDKGTPLGGCIDDGPDLLDPTNGVRLADELLTDGVWLWPSSLAYYVARYHVRLPDEFVEQMRRADWCPAKVDSTRWHELLNDYMTYTGAKLVWPQTAEGGTGET